MRGTEAAVRRRCRRAWKATGALLLGLASGTVGCRWTGERNATTSPVTVERANVSAPSLGETTQPGALQTNIVPTGATTAAKPESSPSTTSGVIQASYQGDPDRPVAEENGRLSQEVAASHAVLAPVLANPGQDKAANETQAEPKERASTKKDKADEGYKVDRTLPSPANGMATPVIPPPKKILPLTLAESLALAGAANPVIALAQQAVRLSQAELLQASVLLVPNINVGADYDYHTGPLQASFGSIRKVDRQSVLYGLGAYSVAAETVKIPGLFINTPLSEVFFRPWVARQLVANRRFTAAATNNQVLLEVSTAYLALLGAEGHLAVVRQSLQDFDEVVRLTGVYVKDQAGRDADFNRARADELALQYEERQAQEEVAVAAADLARLLNLDPSVRLQTGAVPIQVVTFVDPKVPLPRLLDIAARNRPEMLAAAAAIRAGQIRVRQEITRPLIPTIWAGFSADDFGGGAVASTSGNVPNPHTGNTTGDINSTLPGQTTPKFGRITGRTDVDVIFFWTLQNAGLGNLAHVRRQRAELNRSYAERLRILNEVGREVAEAYNTSAQQFLSIGIERRRVQEATEGFQRDLIRIRQQFRARPIEVLDNAKRLFAAREALLEAVIGFDRAQFQLFVALGQPPTLVVEDDKAAPPPPAESPPGELPPPNVLPPEKQ